MRPSTGTAAFVLLFIGAAPASAYHITGVEVPNQAPGSAIGAETMTSADWMVGGGPLCESNGPNAFLGAVPPYQDERNPTPLGSVGIGGVCTSGHNIATYNQVAVAAGACPGTSIDDNSCDDTDTDGVGADFDGDDPMGLNARPNNAAEALADDWIRFDLCSATTITRDFGAPEADFEAAPWYDDEAPYNVNPAPCEYGLEKDATGTNTANVGNVEDHGYDVEIGAFACFVPTDGAPSPPFVYEDYALYVDALYAWWAYDGDGLYSTAAEEAGFHGHVAATVDLGRSDVDATIQGSVSIEFVVLAGIQADADGPNYELSDNPADRPAGTILAPERVTNNCGGSASEPFSGGFGPVFRFESDGTGCDSGPSVLGC